MSIVMNEKEMRALASELAKNIKTEKDLSDGMNGVGPSQVVESME